MKLFHPLRVELPSCQKTAAWNEKLPPLLTVLTEKLQKREATRRVLHNRPRAAVLVPFCLYNDELSLLFTWRSQLVGSHRGQVSFPGGKLDAADVGNPVQTALREVHEEIGILPDKIAVLGLFDDYRSINGYNVTPVIGYLGLLDERELIVNEKEVQQVFMLSLEHLLKKENMQLRSYPRGEMPVYCGGPVEIWGLTACILHDVLELLPCGS
eukprot:jgi/Galph1/4725/GphlegSOOS_G3335.1